MDLATGILWYFVFLFSLTCHEAAHAWAAMRGGDLTAYLGGQVSLDPLPHIRREPFGTVVMPILAYAIGGWMMGWASTPFDPRWAQQYPRRSAWMSLAGPGANLLLMLLAVVALRSGLALGWFVPPDSLGFARAVDAAQPGVMEAIATFLSLLFAMNLLLFVFNLLPFPPLDGANGIGVFLSDSAARRVQELLHQPALAWGGILIAWFLMRRMFPPIYFAALDLLYS